jgi:putative ABC transport system permease protein
MAVGAQRGDVLRLILLEATGMILVGLAVGVGVALAAARTLSSFLYGVSASDPLTFVTVATLMGAIGVIATFLPARRAANLDPLAALRSD